MEQHDGAGWQAQAEMMYDGLGARLEMTGHAGGLSVTTRYVVDGSQVLQANAGGKVTAYLYGRGVIAEVTDGWAYALLDGTNTPRQTVDGDGKVRLIASYTPWGDILEVHGAESSAFTLGYFGGMMDEATGLLYVGNGQYYDPETGRFLNREARQNQGNPYVPWGDPAGALVAPLALLSLAFGRKKTGGGKWRVLAVVLVLGASVMMGLTGCNAPAPAPTATVTPAPLPPPLAVQVTSTPTATPVNVNGIPVATLPPLTTPTGGTCTIIFSQKESNETEINATIIALREYIFDKGRHPYKEVWGSADPSRVEEYIKWIMDVAANKGMNTNHLAYIYATTHLESQWYNFEEVSEQGIAPEDYFEYLYGWETNMGEMLGNTAKGDGYRYMGRGFIHLTGRGNYSKVSEALQLGSLLTDYPAKAAYNESLNRISLANDNYITRIAVLGMADGWFTGKKLSDFDDADGSYRFYDAREIINWPGAQGGEPREQAGELGKDFAEILSAHCQLGGLPSGITCVTCK